MYMKDSRVSYALLAKHYDAPLSTVKSYGVRHGWAAERKAFTISKAEILLNKNGEDLAKVEERHLSMARLMQDVSHATMMRTIRDMNEKGVRKYHPGAIVSLSRSLEMGMNLEAAILGMKRSRIKQVIEVYSENDPKKTRLSAEEQQAFSIDEEIEYLERTLRSFKRMRDRAKQSLKSTSKNETRRLG